MAYLFKHTPLELNFHVNLTCLVPDREPRDRRPAARSTSRRSCASSSTSAWRWSRRRFEFELAELEQRIHILEGFEIVFDALDEAIRIIRKSDGKADAAAS